VQRDHKVLEGFLDPKEIKVTKENQDTQDDTQKVKRENPELTECKAGKVLLGHQALQGCKDLKEILDLWCVLVGTVKGLSESRCV
jgi:hypothetical protein